MTSKKKLFVNFDGLCEPANPAGIPCYGFVVKNENAKVSYTGYGLVNSVKPFSPQANSNTAEYGSAIKAMEWLIENGYANDDIHDYEILLRGDCQFIMRKLKSKDYSPRAARMSPMYDISIMLRSKFPTGSIRFEWVKRDENKEADKLAKEAYYCALRKYPKLRRRVRKHWATMLWLEQVIHKKQNKKIVDPKQNQFKGHV
ncbi:MAG TPA: reverse transcriptase-like protein [Nitrososphaera sp.]|jgi:ribonuclease HI|nr:reverse transcriptase-like protein [Nitrososphaera sp.]